MTIVTIPKKITKGDELIIVPRKDFESFQKSQREVKDALEKIGRGNKEYRQKKTRVVSSPKELL